MGRYERKRMVREGAGPIDPKAARIAGWVSLGCLLYVIIAIALLAVCLCGAPFLIPAQAP